MKILFLAFFVSLLACSNPFEKDYTLPALVSTADGQYDPLPYNEVMASGSYKSFTGLGLSGIPQNLEAVPVQGSVEMRVGAANGQDLACIITRDNDLTAYGQVTANSGRQYIVVGLTKPCIAHLTAPSVSLTAGQGLGEQYSLAEGYVPVNLVRLQAYSTVDAPQAGEADIPTIEGKSNDGSGCTSVELKQNDTPVNQMKGDKFRRNKDVSEFSLVISGEASDWEVSVAPTGDLKTKGGGKIKNGRSLIRNNTGGSNSATDIPSKKYKGDQLQIALSDFLPSNNWFGSQIKFMVQGKSGDSNVGDVCETQVKLQSPIVLTFSDKSVFTTVSFFESKVQFDLNGDGVKEQTGWIGKEFGFLVRDINKNQKIDSGVEMFGEHTAGKSFTHGYLALATIDSNADQKIDQKDPGFKELQVWFDLNQDGVSQTNELKTMQELQITEISTMGQAIEYDRSFAANQVRYSSTFKAAGCPAGACQSFDVFFASVESTRIAEAK